MKSKKNKPGAASGPPLYYHSLCRGIKRHGGNDSRGRHRAYGPYARLFILNNALGIILKNKYELLEQAESGRFLLWLPVCLGAGIALYFSLDDEPASTPIIAAGALTALCLAAGWKMLVLRSLLVALLCGWIGFALAVWETGRHDTPMVERKTGPVLLRGIVKDIERYPEGHERALISPSALEGFSGSSLPETVRITIRTKGEVSAPGDRIQLLVMLFPPPQPAAPGAYDFSRRAYFDGLGAVGIALG
ncbi:MAG: DUF4131 domain-containing protein, partial [Alphaproteobacteria bacterium]|nr:DUF4131 domain-containing protein [Alphaproteobacteria bacterium]